MPLILSDIYQPYQYFYPCVINGISKSEAIKLFWI